METVDPQRFVLAFVLVLGLIGLLALFLKRYRHSMQGASPQEFLSRALASRMLGTADAPRRLQVLEVRAIDARRKLVLIRRDAREHLLLLADGREVVLESWSEMKMKDEG